MESSGNAACVSGEGLLVELDDDPRSDIPASSIGVSSDPVSVLQHS